MTEKYTHPSATPETLAVVDRMPKEGVSGPVVMFHRETDLPLGCFSNFFPAPIVVDGVAYRTSEHYFQSRKQTGDEKLCSEELRQRIINAGTPGLAAEIGKDRAYTLRGDWDEVKEHIMFDCLVAKYTQHPLLLYTLMKTQYTMLVEHTRRDTLWSSGDGFCGQNRLGVLLMQLRELLRRAASESQVTDGKTTGIAAIAAKESEKASAGSSGATAAATAAEKRKKLPFCEPCMLLDEWPGLDALRIAIAYSVATGHRRFLMNGKWMGRKWQAGDRITLFE
jgi:ribA/ribD-fused uncharacterized protein